MSKTLPQNRPMPPDDSQIFEGSGNVFEDMGLPNPDALQYQADLTLFIYNAIQEMRLTQTDAAKQLGLKQPDVSKLMAGRFTHFSTDRLLRLLVALGNDVEIIVRPKAATSHKGMVKACYDGRIRGTVKRVPARVKSFQMAPPQFLHHWGNPEELIPRRELTAMTGMVT